MHVGTFQAVFVTGWLSTATIGGITVFESCCISKKRHAQWLLTATNYDYRVKISVQKIKTMAAVHNH